MDLVPAKGLRRTGVHASLILMRTIDTETDLKQGVAALAGTCAHMARVHAAVGDPPLRRHRAGFAGLARVVAGQQLSISSASAIWRRLEAKVRPFEPAKLARMRDSSLRKAGLSGAKIATLRRLAEAIVSEALNLDGLAAAPDEQIHRDLTAIKGIGPWTADIYIMFCLGRADAWSPGDLALQEAVKDIFALEERPDPKLMNEIAKAWRPWRGVAARLLWSYYGARRKRASQNPLA